MRILHVAQGYYPAIGGTERLIQRLSEELVSQYQDTVTVFTTNCYGGDAFFNPFAPTIPTYDERFQGVKIRRFPVRRVQSLIARAWMRGTEKLGAQSSEWLRTYAAGPVIPGLQRAILEFPADIVLASSFPLLHMYDTLNACQKKHIPCILHGGLHPEDKWSFERKIIYQAIRQANFYIANTEFEARIVAESGMPGDKIASIGVGVDMEPFEGITTMEARRHLGLSEGPILGYIGQIAPHKGVDFLLRAMPSIWKQLPETQLVIAGSKRKFSQQIAQLIGEFSAHDQQKIHLFYDFPAEDKPYLFKSLDVFVYPSQFESFGIAFLEAWSAGKPVVGCSSGAIPWVVSDSIDGLLTNYGDAESLAGRILELVKAPELAGTLGQAGYTKVKQRYTWARITQRYREVYQQVMGIN
jgi:glycosyltransferase involved in cell wall biosynthesis